MRRYRISLILVAGMMMISLSARTIASLVSRWAGPRFLPISVLALVAAMLVLAAIRSFSRRVDSTLPSVILAAAAILFLLAGRPVTHLQLMAAGCFFLGVVVWLEGVRRHPLPGILLLAAAALLLETVLLLKAGGRFLPMNCGVHFLAAMSGFCAAAPLKN